MSNSRTRTMTPPPSYSTVAPPEYSTLPPPSYDAVLRSTTSRSHDDDHHASLPAWVRAALGIVALSFYSSALLFFTWRLHGWIAYIHKHNDLLFEIPDLVVLGVMMMGVTGMIFCWGISQRLVGFAETLRQRDMGHEEGEELMEEDAGSLMYNGV